ncbi:MAG: RNA 2',3'-cyclic phosphodiesterase [Tissierellia bacterium]|nr:RNA 2',3'-cyclic phosphodiesterase [Tissierellia bacterium]
MKDNLRIFIAYNLSDKLLEEFKRGQRIIEKNASYWRPIPANNAHCTIKFLGNIKREKILVLKEIIEELNISKGHCFASIKKWGSFKRNKGQLIYMGLLVSTEVILLSEKIKNSIEKSNIGKIENKIWNPHVTVARDVVFNENAKDVLDKMPVLNKPEPLTSITLYESRFTDNGMIYVPLYRRLII